MPVLHVDKRAADAAPAATLSVDSSTDELTFPVENMFPYGNYPIHVAAKLGHESIVRSLLLKGDEKDTAPRSIWLPSVAT